MADRFNSLLRGVANFFRFIFWLVAAGVLIVVLARWLLLPSIEDKRLAALQALQKERNSKALTLIHRKETITFLGIPVKSYIDINDAEAVLRVIRESAPQKPIDLIMHTPGGLVLAASQIAHALRQHEGKVTVFIPHYAMSGGTLIALAADDIVMAPNAILGPVDPQIGIFPAASIIQAVKRKPVADVEDHTLILEDISTKAIDQVNGLVFSLLKDKHPAKKAKEIADVLTTGHFTHDYPINIDRAKQMGLTVSTDMPKSVYNLMQLYAPEGSGRPSVNYIPFRNREWMSDSEPDIHSRFNW
ncbi:MAG: ATP-dependent Clp protease proteolytic subunit [Desulfohalobiaceae bacterium]|nr:ATP-dependent Clp protease proteolytic subunit [Desulfohalobiaceae bacterium]